jgi:uncharacterized protein (TIGR03437 family)
MRLKQIVSFTTLILPSFAQVFVYNGASNQLQFPVAPGSFTKLSGNFAGVPAALASALPLPKTLGDVQVFINNVAAPIYVVRSDEITIQIPRATPNDRVSYRVVRAGVEIASGFLNVIESAPGIFYVVGDAFAQGGVLNQAGAYAVRESPAVRGQRIQVFGTGEGPLDAAVEDGAAPATLARSRNPAQCWVSVDEAVVEFSGASPQFPGLWQINLVVPDKPYISDRVPLYCVVKGISTNAVSFWVAQ